MDKKPYAEMSLIELLLLDENARIFQLLKSETKECLIGDLVQTDNHQSRETSLSEL